MVEETAVVAATADVALTACVGAHVAIGENSSVGVNTQLLAGVSIGDNVRRGQRLRDSSERVIYDNVTIGDRVILHAGVSSARTALVMFVDERLSQVSANRNGGNRRRC